MMATEATRQQSLNYGCVVEDSADHAVLHYVEKPGTYVSTSINCGVYIFSKEVFPMLKEVFKKKQACVGSIQRSTPLINYEKRYSCIINCSAWPCWGPTNYFVELCFMSQASAEGTDTEAMWIEKDILPALAGTGRARVYHTKNWWSQVKII